MPQRSPIRLERDEGFSKILPDEEPHYHWVCDEDRLEAAEFVMRGDLTKTAILHRTTKAEYAREYPWQVSFFDAEGPWGDSVAKTCQQALRDHLSRRVYRLKNVIAVGELAAGAGLRVNPARRGGGDREEALAKYRQFHRLEPSKVGHFAKGFRIPPLVLRLGEAKHVLYRSGKVDPETLRRPKRSIDYIHEHEGGVLCYEPAEGGGDGVVDVPRWLLEVEGLVLLGDCLGFAFVDEDTGDENEAEVRHPLPELYTIPSGRALIVVQDKRDVLAMMWGGDLGVEARGIVG